MFLFEMTREMSVVIILTIALTASEVLTLEMDYIFMLNGEMLVPRGKKIN